MCYTEQEMTSEEMKELYQNHKIVIWGAGYQGQLLSRVYYGYGIDVIAFFDNNEALQGKSCQNIPIISFQELSELAQNETNIVVKIAVDSNLYPTAEKEIIARLEKIQSKKYIPFSDGLDEKEMLQNAGFTFVGSKEKNKIKITKIDENFSIYKNNKVVFLLNTLEDLSNTETLQLDELLAYHEIKVDFLCVMHASNIEGGYVDKLKSVKNVRIISIKELEDMAKKDSDIMVQLAIECGESDAVHVIEKIGITNFVMFREAKINLLRLFGYNMLNKMPYTLDFYNDSLVKMTNAMEKKLNKRYLQYVKENNNNYLFICMTGKTGDHTLNHTFDANNIPYFNMIHTPEKFNPSDFLQNETIKVITAVREPLGILLSSIYERIAFFLNDSKGLGITRSLKILEEATYPFMKESLFYNGGDAQYIFDQILSCYKDGYPYSVLKNIHGFVQVFMQRFNENIIDISNAPFDKEKGYGIVKQGNIEVFIYQLEKMNDLVKEISDFVGTPFDAWEMGNVANDKWVAASYKQAQKEIKISRDFFESTYNEPWVSHFYSEADIEKFKARWRPHIKEEQ